MQCPALIRLYYKPLFGKKKVSFAKFGKFTIKSFQRAQRCGEKREQREQNSCPERPQRAKEARADEKVKERAAERRGDHVEPQLAPRRAQGKEEDEQRKERAVERIAKRREKGKIAAAQAQGAQQIVDEREREAEQERGKKALCLRGERKAHALSSEQAR